MKNAMKTITIVGVIFFLLGTMAGCKGKSEEERIEELVEKLGNAKTEKEAAEIAEKIEKLEERAKKKSTKEIILKLGEPITFWQKDVFGEQKTRFSITFERASTTKEHPFVPDVARTPKGKKHVGIVAKIKNLGPREIAPGIGIELKVDKGYIYNAGAFGNLYRSPRYEPLEHMYTLEPGQTGWMLFSSEIPDDTTPIEIFGTLGGSGLLTGNTKFRLKLAQEEKKTPLSKKIPEVETQKRKLSKRESSAVAREKTPTLPGPTQQTSQDKEKLSKPPPSATPGLDEKEKLSQQIKTKLEAYSNKDSFPLPPISLTLRTTAPDLVEKVETIYFTALDYQFFSLRSLRFAKEFLNEGEVAKSKKYIEKADRYYKLATSLQRDSFSVLDSTYSAAQWMVAYKASRTALGFTARGLGIDTLFDLGTLYTDYSLDKPTMPLEEAKKNLIAKAISNILLQSTGASDLIGDTVKQGWGSSRAFPVLQKIMGSSEFKDAVLREFMRLGGDVGDYATKKTIEETLERVIRGVNGEKADSTI